MGRGQRRDSGLGSSVQRPDRGSRQEGGCSGRASWQQGSGSPGRSVGWSPLGSPEAAKLPPGCPGGCAGWSCTLHDSRLKLPLALLGLQLPLHQRLHVFMAREVEVPLGGYRACRALGAVPASPSGTRLNLAAICVEQQGKGGVSSGPGLEVLGGRLPGLTDPGSALLGLRVPRGK